MSYTISNTSSITNATNITYYNETYTNRYGTSIWKDIFPFRIQSQYKEVIGSIDYHQISFLYKAWNGQRLVMSFEEYYELSDEEIEFRLKDESAKWLDNEMKSTMKIT